jgi:colanic acid biosynthesis protein WcaH
MLDNNSFKQIVKDSVLIAIDLILINEENKVLLGKRNNSPAKGFYFVPGGRVFKSENLDQALERISLQETGIRVSKNEVKLKGIYNHYYDKDNFWEDQGFSTYYIVIALEAKITRQHKLEPDSQNAEFVFQTIKEILKSNFIHQFTKDYFLAKPSNLFL